MFFNKKNKSKKQKEKQQVSTINFEEMERNYQKNKTDLDIRKLLNKDNLDDEIDEFNLQENDGMELKFNNLGLKDRLNYEKDPKKYREKEFKHARNVLKLATNDINKEISKHKKIDCKEGCSRCCNQLINIFPIEEIDILNEVENKMVSYKKEIVKNQMREWLQFYQNNTPDKLLDENDLNEFNKKLIANSIKCPFLIENKCSIYDSRPLACKSYVSDDMQKCNKGVLHNSLIHKEKYPILNEVAKENAMFLLKFKKKPFITRPLVISFRDIFHLENTFNREIDYKFNKIIKK